MSTFNILITLIIISLASIGNSAAMEIKEANPEGDLDLKFEIYNQFKEQHFRCERYGFNDTIVQFKLNKDSGKPNLVLFTLDRGKINWYEYTYDLESWFDFSAKKSDGGVIIECKDGDLKLVFRPSLPWENDLFNHPLWGERMYEVREKYQESLTVIEQRGAVYGSIHFDKETKVVGQKPYATSYFLYKDGLTLEMSPDAPYPSLLKLVKDCGFYELL